MLTWTARSCIHYCYCASFCVSDYCCYFPLLRIVAAIVTATISVLRGTFTFFFFRASLTSASYVSVIDLRFLSRCNLPWWFLFCSMSGALLTVSLPIIATGGSTKKPSCVRALLQQPKPPAHGDLKFFCRSYFSRKSRRMGEKGGGVLESFRYNLLDTL